MTSNAQRSDQRYDRRNDGRQDKSVGNIWTPDAEVKVGYMRLRVVKRIPTPNDGRPDKWLLRSLNEDRDYEFAPYSGLRLVADRRPKARTQSQPKLAAVRATPVKPTTRSPAKGVELARPMTQAERLDRLEAMLLRVAGGLEGQGKRRAG